MYIHVCVIGASAGEEDVIPIVKWKKPVLPQDSPSPSELSLSLSLSH